MAIIRKSNKLSQTAVIRQILKRCSSLGKKQSYDEQGLPLDVPKGHFVVYVGQNRSRYVVPISFSTRTEFQSLFIKLKKNSVSITTWASPFLVKKLFSSL